MTLRSAFCIVLVIQLVLIRNVAETKTSIVADVTRSETSSKEDVATTYDPARPDMDLYEKFLKNFTRVAVRKALPKMVKLIEKVNMSSSCLSSLLKYVVSLKQIKVWAMRSKFVLPCVFSLYFASN